MSVELVPAHQLSFHRPFTQHVKEILSVRNPNNLPVAFKVKTTAPKQYCVRPNSGRIDPGESVDVQVILQPMKEDPPPDFKCRDKFLVQSVPITPELETGSLQELWAAVEQNSRNSIKENKIRCVYLQSSNLEVRPISAASGFTPSVQQLHNGEERGHVDAAIAQPQQQVYQYQPATVTNSSSNLPAHISHNSTHDRNVATPVGGYSNASANVGSYTVEQSKPNNVITSVGNGDDNDVTRLKRHLAEVQSENTKLKTKLETCKADLERMQLRQRKMEMEHDKEKAERNASKVNDGSQSAYNVKMAEKVPVGYYPFEVLVGAAVTAFILGAYLF